MADKKISALDAAAALVGTEEVPIVQSGETVRTTALAIAGLSSGAPGAPVHAVQFNNPLGTFDGDADFTWVSGSGLSGLQHAAFGNLGTLDTLIALKSSELFQGDLVALYGTSQIQAANDTATFKHTGLATFSGQALATQMFVTTDALSTGDLAVLYGASLYGANYGSGDIGDAAGFFAEFDHYGAGTINRLIGGWFVSYSEAITINRIGGLFRAYGSGTTTNNYGCWIETATGTITSNYGIYIEDQSGVGSSVSENIHSAGASSINTFEGRIDAKTVNVTAGNAYLYGGVDALTSVSAASNNSNWFFGNAGNLSLSGVQNVGLGEIALASIAGGSSNMAIGRSTLTSCTSGGNNVAIGANSLLTLISHSRNVAIGSNALNVADSDDNIAIGSSAMLSTTSADQSIGIGSSTLSALQTGTRNVCIGYLAMQHCTVANDCVAIGMSALNQMSAHSGNTAVGKNALLNCDADSNTAIGQDAGSNIVGGAQNIAVGRATGVITSGSQNIEIGYSCQAASASASGQLSIGNYIYGTGLTGTGSTISTAKIGIGVKAPSQTLDVQTGIAFGDATAALHSTVAMNNGAGANVATITNAPAAGNPTKWIPFDDNGTTRYFPAW